MHGKEGRKSVRKGGGREVREHGWERAEDKDRGG